MNEVVISVGSNIDPELNVERAKVALSKSEIMIDTSQFYITKPLGFTKQADFVNGAFLIHTEDSREIFNQKLKQIEIALGRIKTENKNGPRCIDLDIVVWNQQVVDPDFYERDFIKKTVLELIPDLNTANINN